MNLFILLSMVIQSTMTITSPVFEDGKMIPEEYTCQGKNISPPLTILNIPEKTVSMALIMEDPEAAGGTFNLWVMYNIPPTTIIKADDAPGVQAANEKGDLRYTGPCPSSGVHHYHFKLYALDVKLDLIPNADRTKVEEKMKEHILATGELIGLYAKDNESLNK